MICYKDMTFCNFYKKCKDGKNCKMALTPKVISEAEKWMENAPIAQYVDPPECYKE